MMKKDEKRIRLKSKIKAKIVGKTNLPRLSVFRSNKFIYAQIIDDSSAKTLVEASDMKIEKGTKTERAKMVGKMIADKALAKDIKSVVFDRNGFKYTGRIKLVADEARASGLKF
jgi:large subunit ribosomal protein L18